MDLLEDKEILDNIISILDKRVEESYLRANNIIYMMRNFVDKLYYIL